MCIRNQKVSVGNARMKNYGHVLGGLKNGEYDTIDVIRGHDFVDLPLQKEGTGSKDERVGAGRWTMSRIEGE